MMIISDWQVWFDRQSTFLSINLQQQQQQQQQQFIMTKDKLQYYIPTVSRGYSRWVALRCYEKTFHVLSTSACYNTYMVVQVKINWMSHTNKIKKRKKANPERNYKKPAPRKENQEVKSIKGFLRSKTNIDPCESKFHFLK